MSEPKKPQCGSKANVWIALAGLVFGVVQFAITLYLNQANKSLEKEIEEANKFRIGVNYYKFDHEGLNELIDSIDSPGKPTLQKKVITMLQVNNDEKPDTKNRLGGWPSFRGIHERAAHDPTSRRDQAYWFMALENRGSETVDEVHIRFGEDQLEVNINGLQTQELVFIPIEVSGWHTDMTRTKKRTPVEGWFLYKSLNGKDRKQQIVIRDKGTLRTSYWKGSWQALPNF